MKITQAKITIIGNRPMLINHFSPKHAIPLGRKEKSGTAGYDPDEWKHSVLFTNDRKIYIEPTYIFGCLRDGAKYTKKGKGSLQKSMTATLMVLDDKIFLNRELPMEKDLTEDSTQPVYKDVRAVRNPGSVSGGRNIRSRIALSSNWRIEFTIAFDNTIISKQEMESILIDAGKFCGLGDGRNIGFGRFFVENFEIMD